MLLSTGRAPKYVQIADVFRQRIMRGQWPEHCQLPTNDALAEEFGVSRLTVRQAVDILAQEGVLEARQGRGTFVKKSVPVQDRWMRVETSLAALDQVYRDTSPEILHIDELDTQPLLRPEDGAPAPRYVHMRRVHCRAGQPYCVISIFLDQRVFRKAAARFRQELVIPILVGLGDPAIASARQVLTVSTADPETARLLHIPLNAPVAEVRRVFNTADGTVIYLGEVTYRGDTVRIEMDLTP